MKKYIFLFVLALPMLINAQEATSLKVNDTRNIIDNADFIKKGIRADFKARDVVGVPGIDRFSLNLTLSPWSDRSGGQLHQLNFNNGGVFYRTGTYGITNWAGWKTLMMLDDKGVYEKDFSVKGTIHAKEVKISINAGADFVFKPDYKLMPLSEVENFVKENQHLPEIPSEKQMLEEGVSVNDMQIKLLQKIEELTLYVIEQEKKNARLEQRVEELETKEQQ